MTEISHSRRTFHRLALLGAGAGLVTAGTAAPAAARDRPRAPVGTPAQALAALMAGNRRFVAGHARHPHQSLDDLREVALGQHPFAVLLGCADSRVPPELLFDQGLGDIFDDRVAGNIVDDLLLGSMEYAVAEFAPPLVMVLGHERCGAVAATLEVVEHGGTAPGHIGVIVEALRPIVAPFVHEPDAVERGVTANVRAQRDAILRRSAIVRAQVEAGRCAVVGARYDLDTGVVTLVR
ncbi:carbonic anhydrase [Spirilliplanes yamanashiensis]|uniref:carbonic anhydrase n=1 Tax=Spirilliplanes yamanashiensis TaxID=42233 RepID=A0A8J3Y626_9ACTN|nr:carbonic anhydrase [Spirilliplanes yamanashiensis]MDP9814471.1 carbonic anhydrase [Spirilliplanes yamanashiensis]GIJ02122.1 carbonic anhydrase [Spirilliplanes yamanashiensis]